MADSPITVGVSADQTGAIWFMGIADANVVPRAVLRPSASPVAQMFSRYRRPAADEGRRTFAQVAAMLGS